MRKENSKKIIPDLKNDKKGSDFDEEELLKEFNDIIKQSNIHTQETTLFLNKNSKIKESEEVDIEEEIQNELAELILESTKKYPEWKPKKLNTNNYKNMTPDNPIIEIEKDNDLIKNRITNINKMDEKSNDMNLTNIKFSDISEDILKCSLDEKNFNTKESKIILNQSSDKNFVDSIKNSIDVVYQENRPESEISQQKFLHKVESQDNFIKMNTNEYRNLDDNHHVAPNIKATSDIDEIITSNPVSNSQNQNTDFKTTLMKSIEYYRNLIDKSKAENKNSKVRRYQRILNEFEVALQKFENEISYAYHELVVPPGFSRLPENPFQKNSKNMTQTAEILAEKKESIKKFETSIINHKTDTIEKIKNLKLEAINAKKKGNIDEAKKILHKIHDLQGQKNKNFDTSHMIMLPLLNVLPSNIDILSFKNILNEILAKISFKSMLASPSAENLQPLIQLEDNLFEALKSCISSSEITSKSSNINIIYQKRYIPKLIRNIKIKVEKVNINISQIINLNEIVDITNGSLIFIQLTIPLNKEAPTQLSSNPFKFHPGCISLNIDYNFNIDISNKAVIRQLKRTKILISINIPGKFLKKSEVIASGHILLDSLYKYSRYSIFIPLSGSKKSRKSITSGANVTINIRDAVCGVQIESHEINWPFASDIPCNHLLDQLQFLDISRINSLELINFEISEIDKKINVMQHHGNECDLAVAKIISFCLVLKRNLINKYLQTCGVTAVKDYILGLAEDSKSESNKIDYYSKLGQTNVADYLKYRKNSILKEIEIWKKNRNL